MSTNLLTFRPAGIRVSAVPGHPAQDSSRRKSSSSANWWAPLFGVSPEPDYIDSEPKEVSRKNRNGEADPEQEQKSARPRFAPGGFTEEKARQLRLLTTETSSFHDAMYHSAIASRLASEFKSRPDL
ncbi:hypothetical protein SLE2022_266130 [Rubroshorea leprosula]